jgi:Helix-turn-helix domain
MSAIRDGQHCRSFLFGPGDTEDDMAKVELRPGLTTEEVATILGRHPNRIREMVNENKLDALVVIDRIFIPQTSLDAYIKRNAGKAAVK